MPGALLLIDLQNDFLPGGALAVPNGDEVLPIANALQPRFDLIVATQDWHPADHGSFAANHVGRRPGEIIDLAGLPQILWPVHCVQGTPGAQFAPHLDRARWSAIFQKGTDPAVDSYSGFFDNGRRRATGLADFLRSRGADELFVLGLATDYCVKWTALDAVTLGFRVNLIVDACRGVNLGPGDVDRALEEMKTAGVRLVHSTSV
ncbi:MAG: bifunctional nicotinamidase/pyrazinamidase [Pirellulaceae bacterium]|nr:bifunctional nicotinamidase/pyrazinamidase [Pirellulaceae bacterium]